MRRWLFKRLQGLPSIYQALLARYAGADFNFERVGTALVADT